MPVHVPALGDQLPHRGNAFSRAAGRLAMRVAGWRFEGQLPNLPQFVLIIAPHTSNWDFLVGVAAMFALGIRGTFLGKDTLFRWPFGVAMRWLGGIPVDRFSPHNVVEQVIDHFRAHERVILALSPEGTRKKLSAWRTGFYHVAKGAGVPIVPVAFDYRLRVVRLYPAQPTSADQAADFARLGSFFDARMARHPAQY